MTTEIMYLSTCDECPIEVPNLAEWVRGLSPGLYVLSCPSGRKRHLAMAIYQARTRAGIRVKTASISEQDRDLFFVSVEQEGLSPPQPADHRHQPEEDSTTGDPG